MSSDSSSTTSNVRLGLTILALAGVLVAVAFAWINERGDDAVVARFGTQDLTVEEFHDILESLPPDLPAPDSGTMGKGIPSQVLTQWVQFAGVRAELGRVGYAPTEQDRANALAELTDPAFDPSSAYGRYQLSLGQVLQALSRYSAEAFDESAIEPPEYVCSAHILLESEEDALDVVALLDDGGDFAELAMEFSTGPSGPNGGDLGCVPTTAFVPEYSDGARETGAGISAPVQSAFGFHVINVRSIGPLSADVHPEMDAADVAARLDSYVADQVAGSSEPIRQALVTDAFGDLSDVWVDPRYGLWDESTGTVLPVGG